MKGCGQASAATCDGQLHRMLSKRFGRIARPGSHHLRGLLRSLWAVLSCHHPCAPGAPTCAVHPRAWWDPSQAALHSFPSSDAEIYSKSTSAETSPSPGPEKVGAGRARGSPCHMWAVQPSAAHMCAGAPRAAVPQRSGRSAVPRGLYRACCAARQYLQGTSAFCEQRRAAAQCSALDVRCVTALTAAAGLLCPTAACLPGRQQYCSCCRGRRLPPPSGGVSSGVALRVPF